MHVATLRERIVYDVVLKEAASFSLYKKKLFWNFRSSFSVNNSGAEPSCFELFLGSLE